MPGLRWHELTTQEIAGLDRARTIAVLPVGAIEQHGPHLPLGTDTLIADSLGASLMASPPEEANVLVLPTLPIGHSLEHTNFPGTLSLPAPRLIQQWTDVGRSVARAGIEKLLILNTHGGQQSVTHLAAIELRAECHLTVVRGDYFAFGSPAGLFADEEIAYGLHGGEIETSLMLHLYPRLVRMDAITDFATPGPHFARQYRWLGIERPVGIAWLAEDLNAAGACGRATLASADKGRQYFEHLTKALRELVEEIATLR